MSVNTLVRKPPYKGKTIRKISIETFLRKYRKGKPGWKYEYNKGIIEKTETIKFKEQYIFHNLQQLFITTLAFKKKGMLVQELEVWTAKDQWRKPDIAFITKEQVEAATQGYEPIPEFIIEVISKNDKINEVKHKVDEYFKAGVKILWHIFPELKKVEIYLSADKSETFSQDSICSAEPIIEEFKLTVSDIFKIE